MMEFEAAGLFGIGEQLRHVRVTLAELRPDEILVRMVAAGICHTDLTVQHGRYPAQLPIVLGHEGSGIVESVGNQGGDLRPGDHVGLSFMSCGGCSSCSEKRSAYCRSFGELNFSGFRADRSTALRGDGRIIGGHFFGQSSFARYAVANRRNVVKIRRDAPLELIAPFGCGIQTGAGAMFNSLCPKAGASCVVFGAGSVGLSAVMAAKVLGCKPIIVVEPRGSRRTLALELGATLALDSTVEAQLAVTLSRRTNGGADVIVDTTGLADVVKLAIGTLGRGGKLGLIGMSDADAQASFSIVDLLSKGATIRGIVEGDSDPQNFIPFLVDLFMDGHLPVEKLVTFFDFKDINAAIAAQAAGSAIKPVLRF